MLQIFHCVAAFSLISFLNIQSMYSSRGLRWEILLCKESFKIWLIDPIMELYFKEALENNILMYFSHMPTSSLINI